VTIRDSIRTGFSFGLTSAIITTLGIMVGLHSGTHSRLAVIGGILTVAIADAFSDALGIHISEESENRHNAGEIWESTIATFASKFVFALTFIIPVLLFDLEIAMVVSVIWGLAVLGILSYGIAKSQKTSAWKMIAEHVGIALIVVVISHYVGDWISSTFS
jgi:VIT1/CCC1 family predicted Fe2+/Mn2+ transporter